MIPIPESESSFDSDSGVGIAPGLIRGTTKVGEITKKVQERRLKWYGHVMRRIQRRKEGDGNESTGKEDLREDGWTK